MSLLPAYDPQDPQPVPFDPDDVFGLTGPVGREAANDRADVIRAQLLLNTAGYLDLPPGGPTGWPGSGLVPAIRAYQKDNGLTPDGLLLPEGWNDDPRNGETLRSLKDTHGDALAGQPVPAPAEIDARHEALARGAVLSDAPPEALPFRSGQQVAQALSLPVSPPAPPAAGLPDDGSPGDPDGPTHPAYISDANARIAAGASRGLRNARDTLGRAVDGIDTIRQMAPLYPQIMQEISRSLLADPLPATPPSQAANDDDRAATQTPPLVPPRQDTAPAPRPGDSAPDLPDEKLIPPQIRDWYEGLEPFDQKLARELMLAQNRRGDDATQAGNAALIQEYLAVFQKEFSHIRGKIIHVAGGRDAEKNGAVAEEYLKNVDTNGRRGSSWPDVSFKFENDRTEELYGPNDKGERNRVNTQTMRGDRPTGEERRSLANLERNAKGQPTVGFPKLRPDRPGGAVSDESLEAYRAAVRDFARQDIPRWIEYLRGKGILD